MVHVQIVLSLGSRSACKLQGTCKRKWAAFGNTNGKSIFGECESSLAYEIHAITEQYLHYIYVTYIRYIFIEPHLIGFEVLI